jgi:methionine-rich copper-binding protein CopC
MIRRNLFNVLALLVALVSVATYARAAEPTLTVKDTDPLPPTVRQNSVKTFTLRFRDGDGDRASKAVMVLKTPDGSANLPGKAQAGDTTAGVDVTWDVKPTALGEYTASFTVTGSDGNVVTYPASDQEPYKFVVESPLVKWGIFAGGLLVGLGFLPFLVYQLFRSMNRRGDPSGAARGALLVGILLCGALFIYLFASFYGVLAFGIGIIGALAGIVMVLTQRRR